VCHLPVCAMVRLVFVRAMLSDRVEHGCANQERMGPTCLTVVCPIVRLLTVILREADSICNRTEPTYTLAGPPILMVRGRRAAVPAASPCAEKRPGHTKILLDWHWGAERGTGEPAPPGALTPPTDECRIARQHLGARGGFSVAQSFRFHTGHSSAPAVEPRAFLKVVQPSNGCVFWSSPIIHVETAVRLFKDDVMMISAFRGTDPTRDGAMTQHSCSACSRVDNRRTVQM